MIAQPPDAVREALIENVPILIGRADGSGLIVGIEGTVPKAAALGALVTGETNLTELLDEDADDVRRALKGGQANLVIQTEDASGLAYFEVKIIFDQRRGEGAYFLIHDVTETRQLQIALLNCTDHEQMRIGQDLHDTLGQELTGIAYRLHSLHDSVPAGLAESVHALQQQVSSCLQHSRDIAFKLSPHIEGGELVGAMNRLCAHIADTFKVECVFSSEIEQPIVDQDVAFHLFRIAQEACTNAVRHGAAQHIDIWLATGAENKLEITDNGVGIDYRRVSDFPGTGIPTMKFRAESINGSLRVSRRESGGTIVRCRFTNRHPANAAPPSGDKPCEACS